MLDNTKNETHGICVQKNVDIESQDLQLMEGKNNISRYFDVCHERERLQDKVDEPSILQQWSIAEKNQKGVEELRSLMLLGGLGLAESCVLLP